MDTIVQSWRDIRYKNHIE